MTRTGLAVLLVVAILGLGTVVRAQWVVFDPTNYAEAIKEFIQLEQQYTQLVQTYKLLAAQAQRDPGDLSRYRGLPTPWLALTAPDTYGVNGGWVLSANTGHNVPDGYAGVTQPIQPYGPTLETLDPATIARLERQYGAVELTDGVTTHSLEMLGHVRNHSTDVEFALRRLEDDSFAGDDDLNTQVAVLNKINAATVTAARLTKDTNQILVAQLEQQLMESTRQRDATAQAIAAQVVWQQQEGPLLQGPIANTTTTLTQFRLP